MKALKTFIDADLTIYHPGDAYPREGEPDPGRVERLRADGLIGGDAARDEPDAPKPKPKAKAKRR